ncbi:AMMECR1 domain-containing protein [Aphelenchoides besseyi]|nr:AMMECR1 domain-containing protein [Aphelenchoides besseyi]
MTIISIEMPCHCFDVLIARLNNKPLPAAPSSIPNINFPLFVTWKKGADQQLRGCIGTFSTDLPLHKGLTDYAITSAFNDHRFRPIELKELYQLSCGVSLLVQFEEARDYRDWTPGTHGIHITFSHNGRELRAVFLPDVIAEHGWNHVETMNRLFEKAGFRGTITEADRMNARVERFQSEKMTITYQVCC